MRSENPPETLHSDVLDIETDAITDGSKLKWCFKHKVVSNLFFDIYWRRYCFLFRSSQNTSCFSSTASSSHVQIFSRDYRPKGGLTCPGWKEERGPATAGERGAGAPAKRGGWKVTSMSSFEAEALQWQAITIVVLQFMTCPGGGMKSWSTRGQRSEHNNKPRRSVS